MVRRSLTIVLAIALAAGPANGQAVDWSMAGGGLFGPIPAMPETETPPTVVPIAPDPPYAAEIEAAALAHGLDPRLLFALVATESAFRPHAVSSAGAAGLTQLMPATARQLRVEDRFDPVQNLQGGAAYLAQQIVEFQDIRLALAAYNAGPSRVARLGRVPDIPETRQYVALVIECYLALVAGRRIRSSRDCAAGEGAP